MIWSNKPLLPESMKDLTFVALIKKWSYSLKFFVVEFYFNGGKYHSIGVKFNSLQWNFTQKILEFSQINKIVQFLQSALSAIFLPLFSQINFLLTILCTNSAIYLIVPDNDGAFVGTPTVFPY